MLKNLVLFILLVLGMGVSIRNTPLGIIFNFCVILIIERFSIIEGFQRCNFSIPTMIVDDEPIVIPLGGTQSGCEDEESSNIQTVSISSTNNSFQFAQSVPKLTERLKGGDKIKIRGTPLRSSTIYTITEVDDLSFKVAENISADYFLSNGILRITFDIIEQSSAWNVYNKVSMKNNVENIDKYNSKNNQYLQKISSFRDIINDSNEIIQQENQNIKVSRRKINSNKDKINDNQSNIQNRTAYMSKLDQGIVLSEQDLREVNNEYKEISENSQKLEDRNEQLMYQIQLSNRKIEKAYQEKCRSRYKIEKLLAKIRTNNLTSLNIDSNLSQHNLNFKNFKTSCAIPVAEKQNYSSKRECS